MPLRPWLIVLISLLCLTPAASRAAEPTLETRFDQTIKPYLNKYCISCHGPQKQESKLNLSTYNSVTSIVRAYPTWEGVLERVEAGEMPPEKSKTRPTAPEREAVVAWLKEVFDRETTSNAGDPGIVLARRLSNPEYDNTIRDLTGVDLRPTREFPIDPANEAGFANSGESLTMSPALLKKYLEAARKIADHVVLGRDGLTFAPHSVVTDTDRDKYCVQRIINYYNSHKVDFADYFYLLLACEHFYDDPRGFTRMEAHVNQSGLSLLYYTTLRTILYDPTPKTGPLGDLQARWKSRPKAKPDDPSVKRWCNDLRDYVIASRKKLSPTIPTLSVKGVSRGSQWLVLWRNEQVAKSHQLPPDESKLKELLANAPAGTSPEAFQRDVARFCDVFPDAFFISDRGPYFDPKAANQGRPLTAGFHLMTGYSRDDEPLCKLILGDERVFLDILWHDLYLVTNVLERQYNDFIFFERAEPPRFAFGPDFDFARSENKDTSEPTIRRLQKAYLTKAKASGANDVALKAIEDYFNTMATQIAYFRQWRLEAQELHIEQLQEFAHQAYRISSISPELNAEIAAFYQSLRKDDNLSHEDAIRDSIAAILTSPRFLYRTISSQSGRAIRPLTSDEIAMRLSYFLWSGPRDFWGAGFMGAADYSNYTKPESLIRQTRRMLKDKRSRALAEEFFATWLDIRRFEEHNAVDRARFPQFTNELRSSMYEEPLRFFQDVVANNRPITDFLFAKDTFVNAPLAKHYGIPIPDNLKPNDWFHVPDADKYNRGGLLPMSVFLTANSPGLRTSPVKRGYWVVKRVLGTPIPPPPAVVPELPKDEASTGDLTLAQLLVRHRADKACASCHQRFDSVGLVFEGYGPIGERRTKDLGGRAIDTHATLPDGSDRADLAGLKDYLRESRTHDFADTFLRRLFAYALGRTLILSDEPTIKEMHKRLGPNGYRFVDIVEFIVTTKQFLNARDAEPPSVSPSEVPK